MGLASRPKWVSFLLNRSGPREKDGFMIAVSTKFPRTQIRCVQWMLGRIIGLRLHCGVGRIVGDVYFISAYAPAHDERTQTSTSDFELKSGGNLMESSVKSGADAG